MNSNIKEFEKLSVEKKTLSTALGFEPRPFDCRSTDLTTELHRRPTYPSPLEDLLISQSTGNQKIWVRIPAQSKASFFYRKIFKFFNSKKLPANTLDLENLYFNVKDTSVIFFSIFFAFSS